ncbi:MAG: flagellar basal body-associated FliL family protein [Pseudomonadota bacterium]|nr:flagellar basal body-associated FliL family protein [Pseudomonadota bacterium]
MSATKAIEGPVEKKKGGKLKLVVGGVVVLVLAGAGGWFSGVIPGLLRGHASETAEAPATAEQIAAATAPVFVDMPDIIANMNNGGRRASFIKLRAKLELARKEDAVTVQAAMPRVLDLFQSYLREVRPEELRGSAGTYRLREELIGRVNVAAAPAHVLDVLFTELLVQ